MVVDFQMFVLPSSILKNKRWLIPQLGIIMEQSQLGAGPLGCSDWQHVTEAQGPESQADLKAECWENKTTIVIQVCQGFFNDICVRMFNSPFNCSSFEAEE